MQRVILVVNFRRSVIIAELWRPPIARRNKFSRNFCLQPIMVKFWKFCSKSFRRNTDRRVVFTFCKIWLTKSVKSCSAYLTKKNFAWLSRCRYCANCAQNLPGPVPDKALRMLHISSESVHFWQSYSRAREHRQMHHKVNSIFGWRLASRWIITNTDH